MYYTKDTYRDVEFFNIEPDTYGNPRVVVWYGNIPFRERLDRGMQCKPLHLRLGSFAPMEVRSMPWGQTRCFIGMADGACRHSINDASTMRVSSQSVTGPTDTVHS